MGEREAHPQSIGKRDNVTSSLAHPSSHSVFPPVHVLQMYLQHLNFLSVAVSGDGMFSEVMLTAVRRFQESHNRHDSSFSSSLLVDGHLNSVTFQYLRQAFLTLYASVFR